MISHVPVAFLLFFFCPLLCTGAVIWRTDVCFYDFVTGDVFTAWNQISATAMTNYKRRK